MSNNKPPYPSMTSVPNQQGAVLIVVLLFLVLIVFAGAIAVRQSTTDLKLSTSDQINTLLLQSADNANQNLEQSVNGDKESDIYKAVVEEGVGPFGHFRVSADNFENEYAFCFRPRGLFVDINQAIITVPGRGVLSGGVGAYCDPSEADDYISDRNASMTQVNISLTPTQAVNELFPDVNLGENTVNTEAANPLFDINSTSILPAYAGSAADARDCFAKTAQYMREPDKSETISGCMADAGIPTAALYQQVQITYIPNYSDCSARGVGGGVVLCTLPD